MANLYTTLWMVTQAYAVPLGYYGSVEACHGVANGLALPAAAQVLCVPSDTAMPLDYRSQPQAAESQSAAPTQATASADIAKVSQKGVPFIGDPNAPAVMAYWFDYQCPFCKQNEEAVLPRLISDYVKTGKLKILFKDYAFLGPDSQTAGFAARAVWEIASDKFYEWHKAMYDQQGEENSGWAKKENILALTKTIAGIEVGKVEQLMRDHAAEYQKAIEADGAEGASMGVNGTPGALVGRQLIIGAQPVDQFKAAIEAELSAHK
jgi:protein-disulfide isomerase